MERFSVFFAVAVGGAAGALSRWGLTIALRRISGASAFPFGTLATNAIGCFALGVSYVYLVQRSGSPAWRMGVVVGLLGAMTTFSTYSLESVLLLEQRRYAAAGLNVLGSVALGLAAVIAGIALARKIQGGG